MKSVIQTGLALLVLAGCDVAVAGDAVTPTARTAYEDVQWDIKPGGRQLAAVQGDYTKGAHIKLIRFGAGQKTPPHTHSYSYTGVVVKGQARHYEPGKPDTMTILPPGSFWMISANTPHISECLPGEDCVFATQSDGPFDVKRAP